LTLYVLLLYVSDVLERICKTRKYCLIWLHLLPYTAVQLTFWLLFDYFSFC